MHMKVFRPKFDAVACSVECTSSCYLPAIGQYRCALFIQRTLGQMNALCKICLVSLTELHVTEDLVRAAARSAERCDLQ